MYKVTGKYSAILKVSSGSEAYAVDINHMTVRKASEMTIGEMNNDLIYITEETQSEESSGEIDTLEEKDSTEKCEKIRENTNYLQEQCSKEDKSEVKNAETPKSSSADNDSKEVENSTKKKIDEEKKRKKAEANAIFKAKEERIRRIEKMVDMYANGVSKEDIAKEFGKNAITVLVEINNYLNDVKNKIDSGKLKALLKAKWDNKKIASEFHVSEGAITLLIERGM